MKNDPIHNYFGTPASEWIAKLPNDLEIDDIAIWQIVLVGRYSFGLSGDELTNFINKCIVNLLEKGASPVMPIKNGTGWSKIEKYQGAPKNVADMIVSDLNFSEIDTDSDFLWFTII